MCLSTEILGYLAAACTTLAILPQAVRIWRTRSAADVSLAMYVLCVVGLILWILYGIRIHSLPVIVANVISVMLASAALAGKIRFGPK